MSTTHENVTSLTGQEPDTSAEAICARIDAIVAPFDGDLANYLKGDHRTPVVSLVSRARAVARLLEEVSDEPETSDGTTFSNAGSLIEGLLAMVEGVEHFELDQRIERDRRKREREEAEGEAWSRSPAAKVDVVGFMTGLNDRSRDHVAKVLEELEAVDAKAAEIARARIEAGQDATLAVSDTEIGGWHSVALKDASGETLETWKVGPETAEALRPLAQEAA